MKKSSDFVSIQKVYDTIEAELIRGQLDSEGIPSFLKADNAGGSLSYFTSISGIDIMINREDVERAQLILEK